MIVRKISFFPLLALICLFVLAAGLVGVARAPWWDEAAFADSAYNLAYHGKFASTTWHPVIAGLPDFPHIDEYTYWMMPLYSATLGGWFYVFGFSIFSMHFYSLLWGVGLILSAYVIVDSLLKSRPAALFAAALTAVNTSVVYSSSTGRPDCMTASLGTAALAGYLALRMKNLSLALLVSWLLAALSVCSHPLGGIHVGILIAATIILDWRRLRPIHLVFAACPMILAALGCGIYIAKAPTIARAQFFAHVGSRAGGGVLSPVRGLYPEIAIRYGEYFMNGPGWMKVRLIIPLAFLTAYAYLVFSVSSWRMPAVRLMIVISPVAFLGLSILDGSRFSHYLVHVFPVYCAMCAVSGWYVFQSGRTYRGMFVTMFCLVFLLQAGLIAYKTQDRARKREYEAMVREVRSHTSQNTVIMGSAEFMFELGRGYRLIDDARLGFYSGIRPQFLIRGAYQPDPPFFQKMEPQVVPYLRNILENRSELIAHNQFYTLYRVSDEPGSDRSSRVKPTKTALEP